MPDKHSFMVETPDRGRAHKGWLDRAAAEQLAIGRSRRTPGIWRVVPFGESAPVAKFEDGKRVKG